MYLIHIKLKHLSLIPYAWLCGDILLVFTWWSFIQVRISFLYTFCSPTVLFWLYLQQTRILQLLMQLSSQKKLIQQVLEFSAHRYFHMFSIQWIFKSFCMIRWKDVWCVDKAGPNGQRNKCSRCKIDLVCLLQFEFRLLKDIKLLICLYCGFLTSVRLMIDRRSTLNVLVSPS